jgi:predicted permease
VILTYGYWQRRFGGSASALGRSLTVDGRPRTIIGAMPKDFRFPGVNSDVLLPQRFDRSKVFLGNFSYQGIARLKPGVTLRQADADVGRMVGIWLNAWPPFPGASRELFVNARITPKVKPLKEQVVGDVGATLWVLAGTIGLVLVIACANVANLLLVRAESPQQELAIRAALGAGWGRLARELVLESMLLGVIGGVLGLGLASGGLRMLLAHGPATLPRLAEIGIDPAVLAFNFAVSLLAGVLFGLIPVIKYAGPQLALALRAGSCSMSRSRERHRTRNVLVVVQVALALVLLIGSGLMIRTFQALRAVQPGFKRAGEVQLMRISIPEAQVREPERVMRMENEMLDKLAAIPAVSTVAFSSGAPLDGNNSNDLLYAEDHQYAVNQIPPIRRFHFVSPRYFEALGIPMITGSDYTWDDLYNKRRVTIISENLARELWGDPRKAVGKRIRQGLAEPWHEIIAVVGDVREDGVHQAAVSSQFQIGTWQRFHKRRDAVHAPASAVPHEQFTRTGTPEVGAHASSLSAAMALTATRDALHPRPFIRQKARQLEMTITPPHASSSDGVTHPDAAWNRRLRSLLASPPQAFDSVCPFPGNREHGLDGSS